MISNNFIPRPPTIVYTSTTSVTSTTTTTTTTIKTTTTKEPVENNEVIRGRPQVLDLQGQSRGRVKILVRHKKRPEIIESSSAFETTTEKLNSRPKPVFRRQRVRFMPTQIEVRTEKSVRTATSKSFIRPSHSLFSKRNGLFVGNETKIDEILQAPPNIGGNVLMAIRSFCRRPPMEKDEPHCFRPEPLYFYNVTSASCEPFFKGHCARSRNKFESVQICQERCLVTQTAASSKDSNSSSKTAENRVKTAISSTTTRPSFFKPRLLSRRRGGLF